MKILDVLQTIRRDPSLLERQLPELKGFLSKKAGKSGQGVANSIPDHEVCFADVLNSHGFLFLSKDVQPTVGFPYYHHQIGGTQTKIDFQIYETVNEKIVTIPVDLKHTNSKTFYLNDGWFDSDTIYIVSWTLKKINKVLIAYGNDIPTDEEQDYMNELIALKKKLNTERKNTGSLVPYIRFANQYKCDRFTEEFTNTQFEKVLSVLSVQSTELEPHSQSASQQTEVAQQTDE